MKCIVVDDECTARAIVTGLCEEVPELEMVAEFPNAVEALKYLNTSTVDVIFLDIHMPLLTGMDFIQTLKNPPSVVLTTSDEAFAIAAYEYEFIVDYLVKPITTNRFKKTIGKLKKGYTPVKEDEDLGTVENDGEENLYINIDRRLIKLRLGEILIVEAKGDYIEIKTLTTTYRVHATLKKIKEKLPETRFMQIHRSYIINFTKIIDIQDNSVLIERSVIPISRSHRPNLMQRLNLL
ncbi:MAG: LytTR family DNA-binding domain-containing protein [Bacteroidota bacterium]